MKFKNVYSLMFRKNLRAITDLSHVNIDIERKYKYNNVLLKYILKYFNYIVSEYKLYYKLN